MKKPTLGRGARAEARRGGSRIAEGATPLCEGLEQRVMLSTVVWDGGAGSMDWNTPANWDGDVLPTIADDVEIPPLGGDAVLVSGDAEARTLTSETGIVIEEDSTLRVDVSTEMYANLSVIGGTLRGGTVEFFRHASLVFTDNHGTLADVELLNPVDPGWGRVRLEGNTRFPVMRLSLHGAQTLWAPGYTLRDPIMIQGEGKRTIWVAEGGDGDGTIAPGASITLAAGSTANLGIQQSAYATLVNQGLIVAEGAGRLDVGRLRECINEGTLRLNSGTLRLIGMNTFSNPGSLEVHGGTLELSTSMTTDGLGLERWTRTGGTVELTSSLDNHGRTLTLNSVTGSWKFSGSINGGTVEFADGAELVYSHEPSYLRDVDIRGDIRLSAFNGQTTLMGSTRFDTLFLTGAYAIVHLGFDYVLHDTVVADGVDAGIRKIELDSGGATFAAGASILLDAACGGDLEITRRQAAALVNHGEIVAESAASELRITSNLSSFENTGTIRVIAGKLSLYALEWHNSGQIAASDAEVYFDRSMTNTGQIVLDNCQTEFAADATTAGLALPLWTRTGGTFTFSGELDNTDDTLSLDSSTGSWILADASFLGGVISFADGAGFEYTNDGVWFGGVELMAEIVLDDPGDTAFVYYDTRFVAARLQAEGTRLRLGPGYVLQDAVIAEGDAPGTRQVWLAYAGAGDVVFGPDASVTLAAGCAGDLEIRNSRSTTLVNQGRISALAPGRMLSMTGSYPFTNAGTVEVRDGAMSLAPDTLVNIAEGTLTDGVWIVEDGVLATVGGDIAVLDADVTLDGTAAWAQLSAIAANDGTLRLGSEIVAAGSFINRGTLTLVPGGNLVVGADFTQTPAGSLVVSVSGPDTGSGYGTLHVTGVAFLAGSLAVEYHGGFLPIQGTFFDFLVASSTPVGAFEEAILPSAPSGDKSVLLYTDSGVSMLSTDLADVDLNGLVDTRDLLAYLNLWASDNELADLNGDGVIDTRDFLFFLNLFTDG